MHRGPDDEGRWYNLKRNVFLAHRRLSIVDLSASGSQPMRSFCGRYTIVLNGEIYNHRQLRNYVNTLHDGIIWRGHSDTEVLVNLISKVGIKDALERCNGMFAFALWDENKELLYLARDRFGEKPAYFSKINDELVFASELKAIKNTQNFQNG